MFGISLCSVVGGNTVKLLFHNVSIECLLEPFILDMWVVMLIVFALMYPIVDDGKSSFSWFASTSVLSYFAHEAFLKLFRLYIPGLPMHLQSTILFLLTELSVTVLGIVLYYRKTDRKFLDR